MRPRWTTTILTFLLFWGLGLSWLRADIYRYRDEKGVWHFTNIKSDARYKLYIKTPKGSPDRYIKKYGDIIAQASRRFGVEESLIKAVIKAESDFDPRAVSHKGAQGLMQLMPETARGLAVTNPLDPHENIFGGTRYLALLLKRFGNDKRKALAAYNAGPERVIQSKGIPSIPETVAFVERVLKYYQKFHSSLK